MRYPRLQSRHEDLVQEAVTSALIRLHNEPTFVPEFKWLTYLITILIRLVLIELRREEIIVFDTLADETAVANDSQSDPEAIHAEVERRERQSLLLSDILREYVVHCERGNQYVQKEVYERRWSMQTPKMISEVMGLTEDNVNQHMNRARKWVRDRIQQADVSRSVFLTLFHGDVPRPSSLPPGVPANFNEVMQRLVQEAGVLCPSDTRLNLYVGRPATPELRDVRFHVEGAQCPLCQARSGSLTED